MLASFPWTAVRVSRKVSARGWGTRVATGRAIRSSSRQPITGGLPRRLRGSNNGLKLIERFTPVGPDTLRYEFTLDDPATWTRPWTAQAPLPRVAPPLYEFACHEQNYGLINLVMGAQVTEAEAAAKQGSLR